jgi:uncharacterized membrane protein YbhN (UPF0104 family)
MSQARRQRAPQHAGGGEHPVSIDKRKALIGVALAVLLAGGAFTVIGQVAQFGKLQTAINRADKVWLPVCFGGQLLAYIGYILAYRDAARASGGPEFSLATTARIVVFGSGTSIIGASVSGLAVAFWAIHRTGTRLHTATRRAMALGTIEWAVLSLYGCVAAALVLVTDARAPTAMALAWLIAVPACFAGAWWFTSPRRVRRFIQLDHARRPAAGGRLARAAAWLAHEARTGFADALAGVVLVRHLFAHPLRYHGGAIGYPIYWAGDMLTLYAGVRAFGVHVNIVLMVLAYATSNIITLLPLPAGGAGGIDAGMTFALRAIGIPLAPALLAVLVYRVITFWLPTLPALALLPSIRRLSRDLPSVPHTRPDADEGVSFRPQAGAT